STSAGKLILTQERTNYHRSFAVTDERGNYSDYPHASFFSLYEGTLDNKIVFVEIFKPVSVLEVKLKRNTGILSQIIQQTGGKGVVASGQYFIIHSAQPQPTEAHLRLE
ncbi:hypothetical protein KJ654_02580, partial [Patescibacteria group bacterium]|nr:hypothetical protein [Patescibacteria group bacterium]MBU1967106.1 hypothetical protein [Patescibacteria group bacterium]